MFLKKTKMPSGDVHFSLVEKYHDSSTGKVRQHTICSLGTLSSLREKYDDPEKYVQSWIDFYNIICEKSSSAVTAIDLGMHIDKDTDYTINLGSIPVEYLYRKLQLPEFFRNRQRHRNDAYNADDIFRSLLFGSILSDTNPLDHIKHMTTYTVEEMCSFFSFVASCRDSMFMWLNSRKGHFHHDNICFLFDNIASLTFDEKPESHLVMQMDKKADPIRTYSSTYLSIYADYLGIPLAFRQVCADQDESLESSAVFEENLMRKLDLKKIVTVGRRENSDPDEINNEILQMKSGKYIYSLSHLWISDETMKYALKDNIYRKNKRYEYKTRLISRHITDSSGKKHAILEKMIILKTKDKYYHDVRRRKFLLKRARAVIENPEKINDVSVGEERKYITELVFCEDGSVNISESQLTINEEYIAYEKNFDGMFFLLTNLADYPGEILADAFLLNFTLESYIRNIQHDIPAPDRFLPDEYHDAFITTYNMIHFVSLVILQILRNSLPVRYSIKDILKSLRRFRCTHIGKNLYAVNHYDSIIYETGKICNIDFSRRYYTRKEIRSLVSGRSK